MNEKVRNFDVAAPGGLSPSSDASYPGRLLERQPTCLIRVRLDGALLACSDAALDLLGIGAPLAVLDANLTDRIVPDHRAKWQEFTTQCWAKGAASLECDLVVPGKNARPLLVDGIALKDHADGVESLLLNLRDQSQTLALEHPIDSVWIDGVGDDERQAIAERVKFAVLADQDQAERRRLTEALEAQTADRQRREANVVGLERKVEQIRLLLQQREREYGRDTAMLKGALTAAVAAKSTVAAEKEELEAVKLRLQAATCEQARLEALIGEYEADRRRVAADHQAAVDTLEQSLARAGEEAAREHEQARQALAELRSELAQAVAGQSSMASRAEEQKREHDLVLAEHHRALVDLEAGKDAALAELRSELARTSAEQGDLAARFEVAVRELDLLRAEHRQALTDLETAHGAAAELRRLLSEADAEHGGLATRLEEREHAHERLIAEHHRILADIETGQREALDELRSQHSQALADQHRLAARLEEQQRERDSLVAEHHRALAEMEAGQREALDEVRSQHSQALADQHRLAARLEEQQRERDNLVAGHQRALADMETGKSEALAQLRSQLSQAFADQRRLASRADEQALELNRLRADHHAALADAETRNRGALAELRSKLEQAAAEPGRILAERVEEHERERDRMSAEHNLAIGELQASKDAVLTELRSELSEAMAEQHRLTALLEDHNRERERMAAEHRRAIAELQASKHAAVAECERVLTEVQQALVVRDASHGLEIERRLVGIDEGPQTKVDGEHEPFDDADDAFVNSLLQGIRPLHEKHTDPTVEPAKAASGTQTVTTGDQSVDAVFDDEDATFVLDLMDTPGPPKKADDETDAAPLKKP